MSKSLRPPRGPHRQSGTSQTTSFTRSLPSDQAMQPPAASTTTASTVQLPSGETEPTSSVTTTQRQVGRRNNLPRRLRQIVLALVIISVAVCSSMVLAAARNDMIIGHNTQVAVADVIHVGSFRTTISFVDEAGRAHYPKDGVLYTGGLEDGQRIYVEYSPENPDIVRVQGRTWTLSLLPAGSTLMASLALAWLAGLAITRWEQRRWGIDGTFPERKREPQ